MKMKITVHGVAYEVEVEVLDPGAGFPAQALPNVATPQRPASGGAGHKAVAPPAPRPASPPAAGEAGTVTSPIAGTVLEVKCSTGQSVSEGDVLLVIEAMKMKTSIAAPTSGSISSVKVAAGDAVREGQVLVELEG